MTACQSTKHPAAHGPEATEHASVGSALRSGLVSAASTAAATLQIPCKSTAHRRSALASMPGPRRCARGAAAPCAPLRNRPRKGTDLLISCF